MDINKKCFIGVNTNYIQNSYDLRDRLVNAKFIALRYLIIPTKQTSVEKYLEDNEKPDEEYPETPEGKRKLFEDTFLKEVLEYKRYKSEYAILGVYPITKYRYIGKLAKKMKRNEDIRKGDDTIKQELEIHPPCEFICDLKTQVFGLRKRSIVFDNEKAVSELLSEMASSRTLAYGYVVKFEPIPDKQAFWKVINGAKHIHSVKFTLNAPNLLGSDEECKGSLRNLKSRFNITAVDVKLENNEGGLKISEKEPVITHYVNYTEFGQGNWTVETDKNKFISSSDKIFTVTEDAKNFGDVANGIVDKMNENANKTPENNGDKNEPETIHPEDQETLL
ncbi:hypothetical protein [Methanococcus maripaludis]|uniref:hypothetical protein n=1 Tax=Methanococcus maripaludis TaxID=39152 RepID=UPI00161D75D2|nr:hypothetical protein [Methanococcus maripaludis]